MDDINIIAWIGIFAWGVFCGAQNWNLFKAVALSVAGSTVIGLLARIAAGQS